MDFKPTTDPIKSFFYVAAGWLCVALAILGSLLPLLPTTPFLLLASWCFYRGSPRMHAWLHRSKTFGPTLDDWQHYRGVRRTTKNRAFALVAVVIALSLVLGSMPWWLKYIALAAVIIGLYTIWNVPTIPDEAPLAPRSSPKQGTSK